MNCYAVKPDMSLLKETAPKRVVLSVEDPGKKTLMLAGFEDMKMMCYAVFSEPAKGSREIWLEYIFTSPLHREEGYASGLLDFASGYFKELGALSIICRMLSNQLNAGEFTEFFKNRGYIPLSLTGRMLVYDYRDMLDPGVFQVLEKKKAMLPRVKKYEELKNLTVFKSIPIDIMPGEEELSCFFIDKGAVYGAAAASRSDGNTLVIREVYLDSEAEKKGLFLPIVAAVVEEAKMIAGEDIKIQIYMRNEGALKGFLQLFNPPEEGYLVLEFMNCLLIDSEEV